MTKINQIAASIIICFALFIGAALAQTAALLPNAVQSFYDNNGNPLSAGTVTTYIVGTSTLKTTWRDAAETVPNTNPIVLDAGGKAIIYGDGNYRQVLKDRNGNLIWDAPTSAFGAGGPTSFGDGQPVGAISVTSAILPPLHYVFAYGQELSRVTYSALFSAVTISITGNCTSSSPTITGLSDTTQIPINSNVETTCMPSGGTIVSKTSSSITLTTNALVSTTTAIRIFMYGNGNGSSTFNVPDLRGRVLAGRDNMGGTAAGTLAPPFYVAPGTGARSGTSFQIILSTNLPAYTPTGTIASTQGSHSHFVANTDNVVSGALTSANQIAQIASAGGAAQAYTFAGTATAATIGLTNSATPTISSTFTGTPQGGVSTPLTTVQPTMMLNYIIKVLPDINGTMPIFGDVFGPDSSTDNALSRFDGMTGKIIQNSNAILNDNGALTLNMDNNSTAGLSIVQTGSQTGSSVNALHYNDITVSDDRFAVTTPQQATIALSVNMTTGGMNSQGYKYSLQGTLFHNSASQFEHDEIAGAFLAHANASAGGTDTGSGAKGGLYGRTSVAFLENGATNWGIVSADELDCGIFTGASSNARTCVVIADLGNVQAASKYDAALEIYSQTGSPGFKNGILFDSRGGAFGVGTAGTIIGSDDVAATVAAGISFIPITFTRNFIEGPASRFLVGGSGNITLTIDDTSVAPIAVVAHTNHGISFADIDSTVSGSVTPSSFLTHSFAIGSSSNHPLVFYANNTVSGYIDTSFKLNLGLATFSHANLVFNGFTSGTLTQTIPDAVGTATVTWGTGSGTPAVTASSPLAINTTTGNITCATCVTSSAALTLNQLVIGGGLQASSVTTTGTGVITALGINVGSAGAFVVNGGTLGSPSSAGTIPAFTLGGDIAGSGNHMNNVIIGNTGPQAAQFTSLGASGVVNTSSTMFFNNLTAASGTPNSICQNSATKEITVNAALTCTVSSESFKHNIRPIAASNYINAIRPIAFAYNDSERDRWGFSAEQLASVDKHLADGWDIDGNPRSIDQNAILAQLVKSAQEVLARLEALEARGK